MTDGSECAIASLVEPDPKLWNRYVYVGNDPVNFVDPEGLSAWSKFK